MKNLMKIAITGHSAGIGKALATQYESRGNEITGISRRTGHNIRVIPKIANIIESCDMFVNNAQAGFAQTELLFEMAHRWSGTGKHIIVISTMMTQSPISVLPGIEMIAYRNQKVALEEAVMQIRHQQLKVKLTLVRPGMIGTAPERPVPPAADVDNWAQFLVNMLELAQAQGLEIPDISLGPA